MTIVTPNMVASITPEAKPIPPIISATSPLGIIPTPITHELFLLKPTSRAGTPEPINLLIIPKIVKTNANKRVFANWSDPKIDCKLTCMPTTVKNTGTTNPLIFFIGSSISSNNVVPDNAKPKEYD